MARWVFRAFYLAIAPLIFLVFWEALDAGFVWLDHLEVVEGTLIVTSWDQLVALFFDDGNFAGYHRPFYNLLHSLDCALFELKPAGHHFTSVLLHAINALLFFTLLRRLSVSLARSYFGMLLWAVHPVNAPTVGLIHAKADLFVATMLLATTLLALRSLRTESARASWIAAGACLAVALFTKELAFMFPVGMSLWAWREPRVRTFCAATWVLAIAVASLRLFGDASAVHDSDFGLGERLLTFGVLLGDYLRSLTLPNELPFADTVTTWSARSAGEQLRYGVVFVLFVVVQVQTWRKRPSLRKWIVLFNLALLPVAQIIPILHFRADRFLYLPSLALFGFAAQGLSFSTFKPKRVLAGIAIAAIIVGLFACETRRRVRTFANDETLFTEAIAITPDYLEGLAALGYYHQRAGRTAAAATYYARCLQHDPARISYLERGSFVVNYSSVLLSLGQAEAVIAFQDAHPNWATLDRHVAELRYNRAVALIQLSRFDEALPLLSEYAQANPLDASAQFLLGRCAFALQQDELASESLRAYLKLAPEAPDRAEVEALLKAITARR